MSEQQPLPGDDERYDTNVLAYATRCTAERDTLRAELAAAETREAELRRALTDLMPHVRARLASLHTTGDFDVATTLGALHDAAQVALAASGAERAAAVVMIYELAAVLAWYADPASYRDGCPGHGSPDDGEWLEDGGEHAREALRLFGGNGR